DEDSFFVRLDAAEDHLDEIMAIWYRIGDDRIQEIQAWHKRQALVKERDLTNYRLGAGDHPDLDEIWEREREAEIALRLDFKSLFLFGDILLGEYVLFSERVWQAPAGVEHGEGISKFLGSVRKVRNREALGYPFSAYMDALYPKLDSLDDLLGFYRDKFIT